MLRRLIAVLLLVSLVGSLSACIVEPEPVGHPGYHWFAASMVHTAAGIPGIGNPDEQSSPCTKPSSRNTHARPRSLGRSAAGGTDVPV
jgi:hypothetical protein